MLHKMTATRLVLDSCWNQNCWSSLNPVLMSFASPTRCSLPCFLEMLRVGFLFSNVFDVENGQNRSTRIIPSPVSTWAPSRHSTGMHRGRPGRNSSAGTNRTIRRTGWKSSSSLGARNCRELLQIRNSQCVNSVLTLWLCEYEDVESARKRYYSYYTYYLCCLTIGWFLGELTGDFALAAQRLRWDRKAWKNCRTWR